MSYEICGQSIRRSCVWRTFLFRQKVSPGKSEKTKDTSSRTSYSKKRKETPFGVSFQPFNIINSRGAAGVRRWLVPKNTFPRFFQTIYLEQPGYRNAIWLMPIPVCEPADQKPLYKQPFKTDCLLVCKSEKKYYKTEKIFFSQKTPLTSCLFAYHHPLFFNLKQQNFPARVLFCRQKTEPGRCVLSCIMQNVRALELQN